LERQTLVQKSKLSTHAVNDSSIEAGSRSVT